MSNADFRNKLWNLLANIRFKANYCDSYSVRSGNWGSRYSLMLSLGTSGSVAAWALWKECPGLWSVLVVVMQVLHIAKPHFPFQKREKVLAEMSFKFEQLYLECEKLWAQSEQSEVPSEDTVGHFYEIRQKVIEIEQQGMRCPRDSSLIARAQAQTHMDLKRDLGIGEDE